MRVWWARVKIALCIVSHRDPIRKKSIQTWHHATIFAKVIKTLLTSSCVASSLSLPDFSLVIYSHSIIRLSCNLTAKLFIPRQKHTYTHTHAHLTALCTGLPGWAVTRKVKPIWILLKQETVSGSGISWAICKSASSSRQITMAVPHHSSFLQAGCPFCHPTNSVKSLKAKHSQDKVTKNKTFCFTENVNNASTYAKLTYL